MSLRSVVTGFLIALLGSCSSRPDVGIGVLHFEDTFTQRLKFYNSPDSLRTPAFYVDLIFEDSVRALSTSLNRQTDTLAFYPLYRGGASLSLQVLEQRGNWFRVKTDMLVDATHWLYSGSKEKESWRSFWPTVRVVSGRGPENPLRENPSDDARSYGLKHNVLCLEVVEVQGAWLKVKNNPDRCANPLIVSEAFEGFLRWKRDGQILVSFLL